MKSMSFKNAQKQHFINYYIKKFPKVKLENILEINKNYNLLYENKFLEITNDENLLLYSNLIKKTIRL